MKRTTLKKNIYNILHNNGIEHAGDLTKLIMLDIDKYAITIADEQQKKDDEIKQMSETILSLKSRIYNAIEMTGLDL